MAAPVDTPSWWGADNGMTASWSWEFNTADMPPIADFAVVPDGVDVSWNIYEEVGTNPNVTFQHYDTLGGRNGVWGYSQAVDVWDPMPPSAEMDFVGIVPEGMRVERVWSQIDFNGGSFVRSDLELYYLGGIDSFEENLGQGWSRITETGEVNYGWYDPLSPSDRYVARLFGIRNTISAEQSWAGEPSISGIDQMHLAVQFGPAPVPEPASMLLLGSGLIGLVGFKKRKA